MIKIGNHGAEVERWQLFLIGQGLLDEADGDFGPMTQAATKAFQRNAGIDDDGVVGSGTLNAAQLAGFDLSPPQASTKLSPIGYADKQVHFGPLMFEPDPQPGNPEAIRITNGWKANLKHVKVPQLSGRRGTPAGCIVSFHHKGADRLAQLWARWESEGLLPLVLSWDGGWAPRFIRGSRSVLSSHAFATAFDINARWNPLGAKPAAEGVQGSVRLLVPAAEELGFFWGGNFPGRPDGMHFELAVV